MGSQALELKQAGRSEQPSAGCCSEGRLPGGALTVTGPPGNEAGETAGLPYLAVLG